MLFRDPQYQKIDNQQLSRINTLCDRFEDLLQEQKSPKIEDFLTQIPGENRELLLAELLAIEVEFKSSEQPPPAETDYQKRFSGYPDVVSSAFNSSFGQSETPHTNLVPDSIGDFRIVREIGRGGMGVVYEAQQESLDRRVALKVLSRSVFADGRDRERFEREARSAGRLHHSNIVPIFGVGSDGDKDFLVMQLIRGLPLDSVISKLQDERASTAKLNRIDLQSIVRQDEITAGSDVDLVGRKESTAIELAVAQHTSFDTREDHPAASSTTNVVGTSDTVPVDGKRAVNATDRAPKANRLWREFADLILQAAEALQYAHEQGVLHRDIKPANLLLDTEHRLWVADFGLAKAENSQNLTQTGLLLGTVKYMPPEAFRGQSDARSDVYSLGLSLYELTTQQPAFAAENQNHMINLVLNQSPATVRSVNPEVPRDLQTIIHKAIERDPKNRYATASAFAEDLRRFCHDEPILARRTSSIELAWRWARRHKLVATLSAALAVVLLTATTVLSVYANRVTGLNLALNENASQLTTAKQSADSRAAENASLARQAQSSLVGMKIASAFGHVKDGRIQKALVEMQAAWDSDTFESRDDRSHQMRIGSLLDSYPEVVGLAMFNGRKARPQYQPWNDLLMLSGDGVAEIWKPSTAEVLRRIQHDSAAEAEMSSAGRLLITRQNNDCLIWDVSNGQLIQTLKHETPVSHARFSPDGSFIATACGDRIIRFWDPTEGLLSDSKIACDESSPAYLEFVDNDRIIVSNAKDHVRMWSTRTGEALTPPLIHRPAYPRPPAFTIADKRIATVNGKSWFLWNLNDGAPLANYEISRSIESVHFCEHGGDMLINAPTSNITWHYDFGKSLQEPIINKLSNPRQSNKVAISSGGDLAAARSTGGTAFVWNLRTLEIIAELENVRWLEFVDYRRLIVTGDNVTRIISLRHRHKPPTTRIANERFRYLRSWAMGDVWSLSTSKGKRKFHFANQKGRLVHDDGSLIREYFPGPTGNGNFSGCFSPDGSRLMTIDYDTYSVWDSVNGRQIGHSLQAPDRTTQHHSADGSRVLHLFDSDDVAIWDTESGEYLVDSRGDSEAKTTIRKTLTNVSECAMAPNGEYIVVKNHDADTYHVIDLDGMKERFQIDRHHGVASTIHFTKDSQRFITANSDTTVRAWDAVSGQQLGPHLPHPIYARSASISDDGRYAATLDANSDLRTWDIETGEQLSLPIEVSEFSSKLIYFTDDLDQLVAVPTTGDLWQHRLPRLSLERNASRLLIELATNMYDTGSGRSEKLTAEHFQNRAQYIAAWQRWRETLKDPSADVESVPTRNLLPQLAKELSELSVWGTWTCDGETLTSDEQRFARIELPVEPTGSFQISMDFKRRTGNDHIGIQLPFYDGRSLLVIDSDPPNGLVTMEGIDGRVRHSSGSTLGVMAPVDQQRHLEVTVLQSGPQVDVRATLDETEIYRWSGPSRRLIIHDSLEVPNHRRPTIQTHKSRFEIRNVRVKNLP